MINSRTLPQHTARDMIPFASLMLLLLSALLDLCGCMHFHIQPNAASLTPTWAAAPSTIAFPLHHLLHLVERIRRPWDGVDLRRGVGVLVQLRDGLVPRGLLSLLLCAALDIWVDGRFATPLVPAQAHQSTSEAMDWWLTAHLMSHRSFKGSQAAFN